MSVQEQPAVSVSPEQPRVNPVVFYGSSACIVAITAWAMIAPEQASAAIGAVVGAISAGFGWYYFLAATLFLVFVVGIAVSRYGRVKLGPDESTPDYNLFTWTAMLFAAGIGIDLMFFSVAEPVTQFLAPPEGDGGSTEAARQALAWTLFHYGVTGWAMYALMGMALGYFAYRRNLPLSIRSALYPIIGKRVHGPVGDGVELAAVLGTIFGIATSLGIGVVQLNYGLRVLFGIPEGTAAQVGLIAVAVLMATVSVFAGVDKGIRRLSELNVVLAIGLMLFILFSGRTLFILDAIVLNIGDYVSRFADMTLNTFAFDRPTEWLNAWTLFFWAWWIAWAPFVGLFLARISRGRTIRQFVAGVLIVPFLFILVWISIFGNSALDIVLTGNAQFGETATAQPEAAFYSLLAEFPAFTFVAALATFTGLLFYVTSADSGALVMGNFTSRMTDARSDAAPPVRVFWAVATGLLTLAMLLVDGVPTLQSATIIMGLPFSFVMFLIMLGLYRALRTEGFRLDSARATLPSSLSGRTVAEDRGGQRNWRHRLARTVSYPDRAAAAAFVGQVCGPAGAELAEALRAQGDRPALREGVDEDGLPFFELTIDTGGESPFRYQVRARETPAAAFAARSLRADDTYYRLEVFLTEGSQGYDVMGYTKVQLINDILDQYEGHLEFLRLGSPSNGAPRPSDSPR